MYFRMFSSIPGFCELDASSNSPVTTCKNVSRYYQMSSDGQNPQTNPCLGNTELQPNLETWFQSKPELQLVGSGNLDEDKSGLNRLHYQNPEMLN